MNKMNPMCDNMVTLKNWQVLSDNISDKQKLDSRLSKSPRSRYKNKHQKITLPKSLKKKISIKSNQYHCCFTQTFHLKGAGGNTFWTFWQLKVWRFYKTHRALCYFDNNPFRFVNLHSLILTWYWFNIDWRKVDSK